MIDDDRAERPRPKSGVRERQRRGTDVQGR
jgi:hypothetical protein